MNKLQQCADDPELMLVMRFQHANCEVMVTESRKGLVMTYKGFYVQAFDRFYKRDRELIPFCNTQVIR
jgi:hypothetical protein